MELSPGDVVMLKSGGHPLTVAEVKDDAVVCVWMGEEGDLFRETLPRAVLERADLLAAEDDDGDDEPSDENEDETEDEDDAQDHSKVA
ncbi:uncharacterized protein YodC (DUF2158 family) [Rhodopseudomonas rhenobacensis]|uniref:Uncharacterized protein YodC (DUF2158 family) n=1 Tax=Rhodopseudomonas rhenobacensis TaxID=87461 RepID=A0A7W7Z5I1_9BRAD|nr:DUF2158 domain-containing protein [Rhodopseudomonas rhenobacensis]MBB5048359.1 uncharacterized protein YodC (DUF2158 family) [Rhodopseudomonas rhenobacensis]